MSIKQSAIAAALSPLIIGLLTLSTPAGATPLAPGASVVPGPAATFGTAGGETLLASTVAAGTPVGGVASFWWAAVYQGGTGALCPTCLSFYYQVRNDGTTIINRETDFSFNGFTTDVTLATGPFDI